MHEYSNIENIREEVYQILLNIKNIRIRCEIENPGTMTIDYKGSGQITGSDISVPSGMSIVNPEIHIATSNSDDVHLQIEMNVEKGKGYKVADSGDGFPIGVIQIDSIFTPVRKVNYSVSQTRVGNKADYEELHLEIWTDGSITSLDSLKVAGDILVNKFFMFANVQDGDVDSIEASSTALNITPEQYNMTVESLDLSSRTLNCLKRADIHKVGEALQYEKSDLLKIRNFGEKSMRELYEKFAELGLPVEENASEKSEEEADQQEPEEDESK